MQTYVINLEHRADRLDSFTRDNAKYLDAWEVHKAFDGRELTYEQLTNMGFDTAKDWRDPILKRVLTKGEIGCFISHFDLWEKCASGHETFCILEDDVVFNRPLMEVAKSLDGHDLLYLSHSEQMPNGVEVLNDGLVKPCYPYWLAAYIITPAAARRLIDTNIRREIIPCDEYVPRMLDKLDAVAFESQPVSQRPRDVGGTDIEPTSESDYFRDFTVHVLTCGSDEEKLEHIVTSADRLNIQIHNVFDTHRDTWGGTDMSGPGGGQKLNLIRRYVHEQGLPDHDVILFLDGYDTFFCRDLDTILGRYLGFKREVVFSAESHLWPDTSLSFPPTHTPYRYLNSGTYIGRVGELMRMMSCVLSDSADDQLFLQKKYLTGRFDMELDTEGYIFQTHEPGMALMGDQLFNPITSCYPCVYHGNGGSEAKKKFESLYEKMYPCLLYATTQEFEVIGDEMLLIDFLTPEQCREWIEISEQHGGWNPHPDDKFPSHDIHLKELGLWDGVEAHWKQIIAPIAERYWVPYAHYHVRKAFTMKYSMDTQKTLGHHTDASLVTGSVKLNNDYDGAVLHFPRQGVTNKDIPIGKMILFPGQLTHGHYVDQLISGTKYSATFWTARYKGDLLDPGE